MKVVFDFFEKALPLGRDVGVLDLGQLPQEFLVRRAQLLGHLDRRPAPAGRRGRGGGVGHAPAPQRENLAGLRAGGNVNSSRPSSVGTSIVAPNAACG